MAVPPIATKSASNATTKAGDTRTDRAGNFFNRLTPSSHLAQLLQDASLRRFLPGIPSGTVKSRTFSALAHLRQR